MPVLIGEQHEETERVFFEQSVRRHSPLYYAQSHWDMVRVRQDAAYQYYKGVDKVKQEMYDIRTDLTGNYQQHNIKTVLTAVELLALNGFKLSIARAIAALADVKALTGLRGRWDRLQEHPTVICDVAHNTAGLKEVLQQWEHVTATAKHIVIGFVKDKDVAEALALFPQDARYYFCNAQIIRALQAGELSTLAATYGLKGDTYPTVPEAVQAAIARMGEDDALLVTGSFFIAGEVLQMEQWSNRMTEAGR